MQQECLPDLSHTSSAALHADHDHRSDTVFVLSPADKALLQEHLDEFQDADKGASVIIIERVRGQLYQLQPSNSSFDKKDSQCLVMAYVIDTPSRRLESYIIHTPADVGRRLDSFLFHTLADGQPVR